MINLCTVGYILPECLQQVIVNKSKLHDMILTFKNKPNFYKAQVWDVLAQIIFLLMLILLAKGYTVTRGKLRKITIIKLCIFFTIYVAAYIACFICAQLVSKLKFLK